MFWPSPTDYLNAVRYPKLFFDDPELKVLHPVMENDEPFHESGGWATVFMLSGESRKIAVKCFYGPLEDRELRYGSISSELDKHKDSLTYFVPFAYLTKGIEINDAWYPIVKMDWVEGELLHQYVRRNRDYQSKLRQLADEWLMMSRSLNSVGIAHGDLQSSNVVVVGDKLKLIDYDGMYVAALLGMKSHERGLADYQHPSRKKHPEKFGPYLDNFSNWIIYCALIAMSVDSKFALAERECFLFQKADYERPEQSQLLSRMEHHSDATLRTLAGSIKNLLSYPLEFIPPLDPSALVPSYSEISGASRYSNETVGVEDDEVLTGLEEEIENWALQRGTLMQLEQLDLDRSIAEQEEIGAGKTSSGTAPDNFEKSLDVDRLVELTIAAWKKGQSSEPGLEESSIQQTTNELRPSLAGGLVDQIENQVRSKKIDDGRDSKSSDTQQSLGGLESAGSGSDQKVRNKSTRKKKAAHKEKVEEQVQLTVTQEQAGKAPNDTDNQAHTGKTDGVVATGSTNNKDAGKAAVQDAEKRRADTAGTETNEKLLKQQQSGTRDEGGIDQQENQAPDESAKLTEESSSDDGAKPSEKDPGDSSGKPTKQGILAAIGGVVLIVLAAIGIGLAAGGLMVGVFAVLGAILNYISPVLLMVLNFVIGIESTLLSFVNMRFLIYQNGEPNYKMCLILAAGIVWLVSAIVKEIAKAVKKL